MTTPPPHISPIQFAQQPDGSMRLEGLPHVTLEAIQEQGRVIGRDWQGELGLPQYYEDWELLARDTRLSAQYLRFVLMDEAVTRLPGNPRMQPQQVILPQTCPLELGHTSFVIGVVFAFILGFDAVRQEIPSLLGIDIPSDLEGDYIVGTARLFTSPLAGKAWQGLQQNIFTHVCPNVFRPTGDPPGTGHLVQVTLAPGDYPGCPNARVLKTWEYPDAT